MVCRAERVWLWTNSRLVYSHTSNCSGPYTAALIYRQTTILLNCCKRAHTQPYQCIPDQFEAAASRPAPPSLISGISPHRMFPFPYWPALARTGPNWPVVAQTNFLQSSSSCLFVFCATISRIVENSSPYIAHWLTSTFFSK